MVTMSKTQRIGQSNDIYWTEYIIISIINKNFLICQAQDHVECYAGPSFIIYVEIAPGEKIPSI